VAPDQRSRARLDAPLLPRRHPPRLRVHQGRPPRGVRGRAGRRRYAATDLARRDHHDGARLGRRRPGARLVQRRHARAVAHRGALGRARRRRRDPALRGRLGRRGAPGPGRRAYHGPRLGGLPHAGLLEAVPRRDGLGAVDRPRRGRLAAPTAGRGRRRPRPDLDRRVAGVHLRPGRPLSRPRRRAGQPVGARRSRDQHGDARAAAAHHPVPGRRLCPGRDLRRFAHRLAQPRRPVAARRAGRHPAPPRHHAHRGAAAAVPGRPRVVPGRRRRPGRRQDGRRERRSG
jgi:hypothetical protein